MTGTLRQLDDGTYEWTDPAGVTHALRPIHGRLCQSKGIDPIPAWLHERHRVFIDAERAGTMPRPKWVRRDHRGLGDWVAGALERVGIKRKCRGCAKRQAALNRLVPFNRGREVTG